MERRDYILLEIEKIGELLTAIKQKLFGGKENLAITIEKQTEETKDILLTELNFDMDKFLALDRDESEQYLSEFKGFDIENTEQLADIVSQTGFAGKSKKHLEKALQLYELCRLNSKTYSWDRERKITEIKNANHIRQNLSTHLEMQRMSRLTLS